MYKVSRPRVSRKKRDYIRVAIFIGALFWLQDYITIGPDTRSRKVLRARVYGKRDYKWPHSPSPLTNIIKKGSPEIKNKNIAFFLPFVEQ